MNKPTCITTPAQTHGIQPVVNDANSYLSALRSAQNTWANNQYKTSNEALYEVLAGCLRLYLYACDPNVPQPKARREEVTKALEEVLTKTGVRINQYTPLPTKIVRAVFETDRKRASVYSIVLRAAIDHEATPETFASFVKSGGGIEEIRLTKKREGTPELGDYKPFDTVMEMETITSLSGGEALSKHATNDELQVAVLGINSDGRVDVKWIGKDNATIRRVARSHRVRLSVASNDAATQKAA